MSQTKITFIIPSVNRPTILNTVMSLFAQTNNNWECIIIYDGIDGQNFEDERIKILKIDKLGLFGPENGQSGLVRNEGIKLCNTDWIGFLDDDDTIHPEYVDTLFKKYKNFDFVVWRMKYKNGMVLPPNTNKSIVFAQIGISFCYKNKFNNLLFEKNKNGEDFDFLKKLESLTSNFTITEEVFYNVRH